jgi:hypothetical protein
MSNPDRKLKRTWKDIAAEASAERDLARLARLAEELKIALDEREREVRRVLHMPVDKPKAS